jgi:hypothetical protein
MRFIFYAKNKFLFYFKPILILNFMQSRIYNGPIQNKIKSPDNFCFITPIPNFFKICSAVSGMREMNSPPQVQFINVV